MPSVYATALAEQWRKSKPAQKAGTALREGLEASRYRRDDGDTHPTQFVQSMPLLL